MPQIFSISGSFFGSASWDNPAIWYGGIVPTASDQVFIRGIRTTINNTPGYQPWVGFQTLIVANTASLPLSGSLYTYTDRDEEIKINYLNVSASNRLISCSIDTSFYSWSLDIYPITESLPSKKGGLIPNGAFVYFKPGDILITSSMNISASNSSSGVPAITIENGGVLRMLNNSTMSLNGYLQLNDGEFTMTGSGLFKFDRNFPSASTENVINNIAGINASNSTYQKFILDGPEVRTNSTLSQSVAVGDAFITLNNVTGFEVGDHVFIGETNLTQSRTDNGTLGRVPYVNQVSSYDEVFEVVFKDTPNKRLYVERMNGLEGIVLATASATQIIVDEERFKVGDKITVNGQVRTITAAASYDLLLNDYNFQSGSNLSDWDTDITRSFYFNDWTLFPGLGLTQFTTNQYRHLFVKDTFLDNVKVEAYVSNLRNVTNGSGSRAEYGVYIHSDPQSDWDYTSPISTPVGQSLRTAFVIDPVNARMYLRQKNYNNNIYNSLYTASFAQDGLKKITLEATKGFVRGYVNDVQVFDEVSRSGNMWGRVGLYTNGNNCVVCTRYVVYRKCQILTLNTSTTVSIGDRLSETGAEYPHAAGHQVIKLLSVVTDPLEHVNYAFTYRGTSEYATNNPLSGSTNMSGSYPYIFGNNSSGSKTQDFYNFWRLTPDYQRNSYDLGTTFTRSVIIDFGKPVTFNNVGFLENFVTFGQNMTASRGIQFSGSNDITGSFITASNWVPLTASIIDGRFRATGETFRDFNLSGSYTYRFLRIETNGITRTTSPLQNSFRGYRVRYNVSHSLQLNNTSDLNIGDEILIATRNNTNNLYRNIDAYSSQMFGTTASAASFLDEFKQHYTIVNKSASVIYLDRPYEEGDIEKGSLVYKVNRQLKFSGSYDSGSGNWKNGRIAFDGTNNLQAVRRIRINNVSFQHLSAQYPWLTSNGQYLWNGFVFRDQSWYNYMSMMNGITIYNSYNYTTTPNYWLGRSGFAVRHSVFSGMGSISNLGAGPYFSAPVINTGNLFYMVGTDNFSNNFSLNIFSYNYQFGTNRNIPHIGGATQNTVWNFPYNGVFIIKRNRAAGVVNGQFVSSTPTDNIGTQFAYDVSNNFFEYIDTVSSPFQMTTFMDKAFTTPYLLPKRQGWDAKRAVSTYNAGSPLVSTNFYGFNGAGLYPTSHYIKDYNRFGYDVWTTINVGWWVKLPEENYYRLYKHVGGGDYRFQIFGASIYIPEGVTGSFDVSFDYYQTWNIINQNEQIASGSLYMLAYKDGNEVDLISGSGWIVNTLPKSSTPINFNKSYQLTGPGIYQIALGGAVYSSGYTAFANISSRLNVPDDDRVQVLSNTFNMRYFDKGERWLAKTMYTQPINQTKFRLKGARIF